MKRILFATALVATAIVSGFSQTTCTPPAATGTAGFSPSPDGFPCAEVGTQYNEVLNFENFDTISLGFLGNAFVTAIIDSIKNLPCGLTWVPNKVSYSAGETGCIELSGTTTDAPGQYKLEFFMTANAKAPVVGIDTTLPSMEISELISTANGILAAAGVSISGNFDYWIRVKDPGAACVALDSSGNNLTACLPVFVKSVKNTIDLNIYPNPSSGIFTITHAGLDKPATLNIFDLSGKLVHQDNLESGAVRKQIDLSSMPKGIYSLRMTSDAGNYVQKLTIY